MRQLTFITLILFVLSSPAVFADDISGGPRVDFGRKELIVPCVQIVNSGNPDFDGRFFDVAFKQRGKSFNYELVLGNEEDPEACVAAIEQMLADDEDTTDTEGEASGLTEDDAETE